MAKCKKYGCNRQGDGYTNPSCDNKHCPGKGVNYNPASHQGRVEQQGDVFRMTAVQAAVLLSIL